MDRMRKLISGYMVASVQTSAHVQSFIEVDVTNIVKWRDRVKNAFEKREGEKLTFTPIFMEAVAKALKDFPGMNISVDGDYIIKKKNINLGMAAALPNGNLIVPVIKNADQLNLVGMAKAVNDLGNRAKAGKLKPDDTQGGTYTVTNVGTFGSVFGTPIINQPQVGILALGAIRKVPAVIETPEGDFIGIRQKMFLSHSYDHRVVDGALGGSFVKRVAEYLEAFDVKENSTLIRPCYFITYSGLLDLKGAQIDGWSEDQEIIYEGIMGECANDAYNIRVLVLDDVGREHAGLNGWQKNMLHHVLRTRFNNGLPTIVTTNIKREDWAGLYGDSTESFVHEIFSYLPVESSRGDLRK
jgi:hypothetical protein